jgi:hypothetical protein
MTAGKASNGTAEDVHECSEKEAKETFHARANEVEDLEKG